LPHKRRIGLLKYTYNRFREAIADINKGKKSDPKKVKNFVTRALGPLCQEVKEMIFRKICKFAMHSKDSPCKNAAQVIGQVIAYEETYVETALKIQKEVKDPIMVEFKCNQGEEGWAENFKKYNAKREYKKWRTYFLVKKECNKIKFQERKREVTKYTEIRIQEKQNIRNNEEEGKVSMLKGFSYTNEKNEKKQ
jgi:hypothetical protein